MPLTVRAIESAKPKDKPYKLADGQGLYLYVSTAGAKSWRCNFSEGGKQKTRTYGQYPTLGLAEARKVHQAAREPEPAELKPSMSAEATKPFEVVAEEWMKKHLPGLSNPKHRHQVRSTLEEYAYPKIGSRPIGDIRRAELTQLVKDVLATPDAPGRGGDDRIETAYRVAGRVTAVFNYAVDDGKIEDHPASGLTRVLPKRRVKTPMASIHKSEAGELMRKITEYPEPVTRLGLLLAAHTFVRVGELRGFRDDELLEDGAVWVVPEERVKGDAEARLPHVVPLSPQARGLVRQLQGMTATGLLLESPAKPGQPISENTLLFALYRLGYRGRMTVHGFRALASTVLNEESPFDKDVIERQLAHKETDAVRAAYNRAEYLPQRRELMNWWSAWLERAAASQRPASA
jgi:integrase